MNTPHGQLDSQRLVYVPLKGTTAEEAAKPVVECELAGMIIDNSVIVWRVPGDTVEDLVKRYHNSLLNELDPVV